MQQSTFSSYSESFVESRQFQPIPCTCIWRLRWGWPHFSFAAIFGFRKWAIAWRCLRVGLRLSVSVEHRLAIDRHTNTLYRASMASRGKNTCGKYVFHPGSTRSRTGLRRSTDSLVQDFYTWCGLNANLGCRSEMCCTRLAGNTGRKKSPSARHRTTLSGAISSQRMDNRKNLLRCPHNMVN